tara:strand:- start:312 stop:665 length:354 start_codon:yes stop_codon:yes gene_type:complete
MKIKFKKTSLLKIALVISLIGIFLLLVLSNILEPKLIDLGEINNNLLNKKVKVQGEIFDNRIFSSDFQVISIRDSTGKIDLTLNQPTDNLKGNITVIGTVKEYKQYLQIQAEKIISS